MKTQFGMLLTAIGMIAPAGMLAAGRLQDVRVLRSTEQSIQIEFVPNHYPVRAISFNGKEFLDYDFEGSTRLATMKEVGVPDLKFKMLSLGFQSKEGNAIQIVAADYEDIPNVLLKPMPTLQVKDEMLVLKDYIINNESYSQNQFLPGKVADLSSIEQSRSMLVGGAKVYPIQYNPVTKTLRRYSRIVVEVVFGSSSATRVQNDDDALVGGMLLNANEAKIWKFGKTQSLNRANGQPSVLASGTWYRLTIADEGMYILDANWFSSNGISLSGIDPRTIKIYGNGGEELSENVGAPRPIDLVQNAILVEGEADGQFNSGDYVLFYGKGIQGIKYDPIGRTLRHYIHHFSRVNFYWLTFGGATGKRMITQPSVTTTPGLIPTKFMDAVWVEPDTVNLVKSGKSWLGLPMSSRGTQVRTFPLNGLVLSEPRTYRFTLAAGTASGSYFNVRETGTLIGTYPIYGIGGYSVATDITVEASGAFPIQNNTSQLNFEFQSSDAGATGWLDWIEIVYQRTLDPANNYLRFRSPDTTAVVEYRLGQFSGASSVFNVTNPTDVQRVAATSGIFRASEQGGTLSEYLAAGGNVYKVPTGVTSVPSQNLRGIAQPYDFIIITSQEYASAANRLKEHRQNPANGGLKTIVVDVNQIYNEFSCGVPDITAIRDFLKYAYESWTPLTPPKFVCFFGQASYDYRAILGSRSSYVPTWQKTDSPYDDVESSCSDDFFVRFGANSSLPFLVSGRLNPRTTREAEQLVDRIIGYDTRSTRDGWKMRGLFVGDDGWVAGANIEGNIHTEGAEDISRLTPDIFDKKKVYLEEYPTVITAQGRRKPGAYQDIIDIINRGVLIVNFTGHGNPTVWTHESVLTTSTSIPSLFNANKLAYFFGATCNFSQIDDPSRATGSELLMNRPEGGAIGVVSATRKVYSGSNEALNEGIYRNMFRQDQFNRVSVERVATALFQCKVGGGSGDVRNDEKYFVLGDPTLRLQFPQSYASIDSINGAPVEFVDGVPRTSPIQLKSLSRITVKGTIRNAANTVDSTFRGKVTLEVNDATRNIIIAAYNWPYPVVGALIYRGENSVSNGRFVATFVVPKDIAYADSTTRGRVVAYSSGATDNIDGAGFTNKVTVSGSDVSASADTAGPSIKVYLGNSYESGVSFRSGDVVNEKPTLFVDLVDSNGINTSTSGVGHRIEAWLNNSAQSQDLTDFYTSKLDNFQAGTVQYPLRDLPQGRNTIKVRAWDTYNNARTAETYFEVMSSEQLRVVDVMNYPNPFTKGTAFTFRHNQETPVNATVKVYTIAGRLVQTLEKFSASDAFVAISWDGRDRDGDVLANGIYLYKVHVRTIDGRYSSEVLGKLAIAK